MLYQGVLIARASGRLGDSVWSHNRGGPYVRALGNPNPNPPTDEQTACRTAMANIVAHWRTALDDNDRAAWAGYSRRFQRPGRSGVVRAAGALAEFTRSNFHPQQYNIRVEDTMPWIDTPPSSEEPIVNIPFTLTSTTGLTTASLAFVETDLWNTGSNWLFVYQSPELPRSINFYRTPMTFWTVFTGEDASSPFTIEPYSSARTAGTRVFFKVVPVNQDGKVGRALWLSSETPP